MTRNLYDSDATLKAEVAELLAKLANTEPEGASLGGPGMVLVHNELTKKLVGKGQKVIPILTKRLEKSEANETIFIVFCLYELKAKSAKPAIQSLEQDLKEERRFQNRTFTLDYQIMLFLRDVEEW